MKNKSYKIYYREKMERERADNKLYVAIYICLVVLSIIMLTVVFN